MTSEQEFLRRVLQFDEQALNQVYSEYSPGLYRYAARLLGCPDLAEDCVAEVFRRFLCILRNGGGPKEHLQAYLYRVAHNWITDRWRRDPPQSLPLLSNAFTNEDASVSQMIQDHADQEEVRAALRYLTPDQRQVIMLKFYEGWGNQEIAWAIDKPPGAIKALQHRALESLRRTLLNGREDMHGSTQ